MEPNKKRSGKEGKGSERGRAGKKVFRRNNREEAVELSVFGRKKAGFRSEAFLCGALFQASGNGKHKQLLAQIERRGQKVIGMSFGRIF